MERKLRLLKHHWSPKKIFLSALWGVAFLALSLVANYLAGTYATANASNPVNDLILDNIPTFDVDGIFIYGIVLFFVFVGVLMFFFPRRIPFVLKGLSLFIVVRSHFVILTHIGPSLRQTPLDIQNPIVDKITFTGDLFFSGHTGLPFLMALIFWKDKAFRWLFFGNLCFLRRHCPAGTPPLFDRCLFRLFHHVRGVPDCFTALREGFPSAESAGETPPVQI